MERGRKEVLLVRGRSRRRGLLIVAKVRVVLVVVRVVMEMVVRAKMIVRVTINIQTARNQTMMDLERVMNLIVKEQKMV